MTIPNRGDKQYTDIEKFKKYELTHCIAYEMAIRNDEVIKTIKEYTHINMNYSTYSLQMILDFETKYKNLLSCHGISLNDLYLNYHFFYDINSIISNQMKEQINAIENRLFVPRETSHYGAIMHRPNENKKGYTVSTKTMTPYFSRPFIPPHKLKRSEVLLNLSTPLAELKDFLEQIKKEYDNEKLITQRFSEGKPHKITFPRKNDYADMFFAYDCYKLGVETNEIVSGVTSYRYNNLNFKIPKKDRISTHIEDAKDYIDNEKYKYLLT